MDNPYEQEQQKILGRIVTTLEKLNESILALNHAVAETNVYNSTSSEIVELWTTYTRNVKFNLQLSNQDHEPV
ncbi:hypothetical protein ACM66B_005966 [Microbotryomycetes sp. NB124-2]